MLLEIRRYEEGELEDQTKWFKCLYIMRAMQKNTSGPKAELNPVPLIKRKPRRSRRHVVMSSVPMTDIVCAKQDFKIKSLSQFPK